MSHAIDRTLEPEPTPEPVNSRQRKFIEAVAAGLPAQEAARRAGYSPAYSRKASRLLRCHAVAAAVADIRERACAAAAYDVTVAMKEAESAATFARVNKNSMALVKAYELRAKLSGLLIDRVEIATVDLTDALSRAEQRISASMQTIEPGLGKGQVTSGGGELKHAYESTGGGVPGTHEDRSPILTVPTLRCRSVQLTIVIILIFFY